MLQYEKLFNTYFLILIVSWPWYDCYAPLQCSKCFTETRFFGQQVLLMTSSAKKIEITFVSVDILFFFFTPNYTGKYFGNNATLWFYEKTLFVDNNCPFAPRCPFTLPLCPWFAPDLKHSFPHYTWYTNTFFEIAWLRN